MRCTCPQVGRASGNFRQGHANAKRLHAGDEGSTTCRAALLGVISHEDRAFIADAVDVGRLTNRQATVIDARLHPADVVTHDEEDVRLLLLSYRRSSRYNRCHADGEERRQGGRRAGPTSFYCLKKSGLYSWVPPVMGCPRQRSFGLRPVAIKRLRQRQKVRGRRIANTEEAPEEAPTRGSSTMSTGLGQP